MRESVGRILVTDDSITHGSTFSAICDRARQVAREIQDRDPIGIPFAVSEKAYPEYRLLALAHFHELGESDIAPFVENEIHALLHLGKPLDIDHPMLMLTGDFSHDLDLDAALQHLSRDLQAQLIPLNARGARATEVLPSTWTILLPKREHAPFAKLRVFRSSSRSSLVFCLMVPRAWKLAHLDSVENLFCPELRELWDQLQLAATREHFSPAWVDVSRVVCANFLASVQELSGFQEAIRGALDGLQIDSVATPGQFDLQLLMGPSLATLGQRRIEELFTSHASGFGVSELHLPGGAVQATVVPPEFRAQYEHDRVVQIGRSTSIDDILHAEFYAQHTGIELASRIEQQPVADLGSRLDFGVSFDDLIRLVRSVHADAPLDLIHESLDRLIDRGCVVPRYIRTTVDGDQVWVRIFRVGEGSVIEWTHAIRLLFGALAEALEATEIPALCLEKYLVLAACSDIAWGDTRLPPIYRLGAQREFHLYGARAAVRVDRQNQYLLDWAVDHRILEQSKPATLRVGEPRPYRLLNLEKLYPSHDNPFDPQVRDALEDIAAFTAVLKQTKGLGDSSLILLTSVASEGDKWRAISAELGLWLHDRSASFHRLLALMSELSEAKGLGRQLSPEMDRLQGLILRSANFTAQALNKIALATERHAVYTAVELAVRGNRLAERAWQKLRGHLKSHEGSDNHASGVAEIVTAVDVAHAATSLLRTLVATLKRPAASQVDVVNRVTGLLDVLQVQHGNDLPSRAILEGDSTNVNVIEALRLARSALTGDFQKDFDSLRAGLVALGDRCEQIYQLYGPDPSPGNFQRLPLPRFIVMWDVRNSAGVRIPETELRPVLRQLNTRVSGTLARRILGFDHGYDDGNGLICERFTDVLVVFRILMELFQRAPTIRVGCEANVQGALYYDPDAMKFDGRAFEHAARVTSFFKEIKATGRWVGDPPVEPPEAYMVVGEFARRYAAMEKCWPPTGPFKAVDLDGLFLPRVDGALPIQLSIVTRSELLL